MTSTYELICTACPFEQTVEGVDDALDTAEAHGPPSDDSHFVDVHIRDGETSDADSPGDGSDGAVTDATDDDWTQDVPPLD